MKILHLRVADDAAFGENKAFLSDTASIEMASLQPGGEREIVVIAAIGPGRVIGDSQRLPWALPRDMRLFRRLTVGHPVLMGRKTFESLGKRPLPRRRNIVVTHDPGYAAPGVDVAHSIRQAINLTAKSERIFVIGGGSIYQQAMSVATSMLITEIFDENPNGNLFDLFAGDVYFPLIDPMIWHETRPDARSYIAAVTIPGIASAKRKGLRFKVRRFVRRGIHVNKEGRLRAAEIDESLVSAKSISDAAPVPQQRSLFDDE